MSCRLGASLYDGCWVPVHYGNLGGQTKTKIDNRGKGEVKLRSKGYKIWNLQICNYLFSGNFLIVHSGSVWPDTNQYKHMNCSPIFSNNSHRHQTSLMIQNPHNMGNIWWSHSYVPLKCQFTSLLVKTVRVSY